ncbi:unnamed protein product [Sphagnum jensenii]|uniref:Uncharacterized protein n=1 Tax=Sphagnum jensenii TaxID=128206 RepID=A0ABP0VL63_9BRYO
MLPPCRRGGNSDAALGVPWVELESLARRAAAAAGVLGQVSVSSRTSSELGCWKAACFQRRLFSIQGTLRRETLLLL